MVPFQPARDTLITIAGVSVQVADVIIAVSGVRPGHNEFADRVKSSQILFGAKHLKAAFGIAALSVSRSRGTYLAARYRRIAARRGSAKAVGAIEYTILTAIWHMLRNGEA